MAAAYAKMHAPQPVMSRPSISEFGQEVREEQISISLMTIYQQLPMDSWKTLIWRWRNVQQDVVLCQKAELKCTGFTGDCTNPSDLSTDENELSDDDGLLFELHNDDSGFDGIFEPQ